MTVTVVVADDQPLIRAGIVMLINAHPDTSVVGEASDGAEAVRLTRSLRPDVLVMDVRMPVMDGVTATRLLTTDESAVDPDRLTRILVLTTFDDDETVYGALRSGASGFLLKHAAPQDLLTAICRIASGAAWIDSAVTARVIDALASCPRSAPDGATEIECLTAREREVLVLMAHGLSNTEIRNRLVISEATAKTHVSRIIMKTGCRDRSQAIVLAYRSGLVTPDSTPAR